jgi:hypothetical protein
MPLNSDNVDPIGVAFDVRVINIFKRNRFVALEFDEILFELTTSGVATTPQMLQAMLDELVERERLTLGEYDGTLYYRYDNRLGFRPPR